MNGQAKHVRIQSTQHCQDTPSTGLSGAGRRLLSLLVASQLLLLAVPAVSAAFEAYVVNTGSNSVSVIDTVTNEVKGDEIGVGNFPWEIAVSQDGSRAYVTNLHYDVNDPGATGTVSVIDTATKEVIGSPIEVGADPIDIEITPDGSRAYVTNYTLNLTDPSAAGTVSVIDTVTNRVIDTVEVGGNPSAVAITPDGLRAYVANQRSGTVSVIDTATNEIVGSAVEVSTGPFGIAISPDGSLAYITSTGRAEVTVIDTATNTVVAPSMSTGWGTYGIAITPNGSRAYVTRWWGLGYDVNSLFVIDTSTNEVIGSPIEVGKMTGGIAITPDGSSVYTTNSYTHSVTVIDTATNEVVELVDVGSGPWESPLLPTGMSQPMYIGIAVAEAVVPLRPAVTEVVNVPTR